MRVLDQNGRPVGDPSTVKDVAFKEANHLSGKVVNPRLWTAETPNLYQLEVRLRLGNTVVHHSASEVRIPHH
jgi:beta-galactosidase/beta-glucuronidase